MREELDVLKIVCSRLEQAKIPYMVTGSFAASFYMVPRMTRDLDIVIEIQLSDVDKILRLFQTDFYVDQDAIIEAIKDKGMFNIIHNEKIFKIDFIVRKNTSYRRTEFQRKQQISFDNATIWVVAPEDLIISKLYWAKDSLSEMQLNDVRHLFDRLSGLDLAYINRWIKELELEDIYQKV